MLWIYRSSAYTYMNVQANINSICNLKIHVLWFLRIYSGIPRSYPPCILLYCSGQCSDYCLFWIFYTINDTRYVSTGVFGHI